MSIPMKADLLTSIQLNNSFRINEQDEWDAKEHLIEAFCHCTSKWISIKKKKQNSELKVKKVRVCIEFTLKSEIR